jgi:hypothetical protein
MVDRKFILVVIILLVSSSFVLSQEEEQGIDVFGYFQANYDYSINPTNHTISHSFSLQQLNLFLEKNFSEDFSSFVNFELTNSFSVERNWGSFNLEEAWVKYSKDNFFNVKAGLLVPTFNNLNEIKNRTPLLPYVLRPTVYEATFSEYFDLDDYVPHQAYLQAYGYAPLGDVKLDYAAYVGNSDNSFINSAHGHAVPLGKDTTDFKLVGGRIGIRAGALKAGFSFTDDKKNYASFGLGPVTRTRFGADLSCQFNGFTFEGEMIFVNHLLTSSQSATLEAISNSNPLVGNSLDKLFFYTNLMYDFNEQFYCLALYNYQQDKVSPAFRNGLYVYGLGGGWRITNSVVTKVQFARATVNFGPSNDLQPAD